MCRLMIVDDFRVIREDLKEMFEQLGFTVPVMAGSGAEAVSLYSQSLVDVVLMDIMMESPDAGIRAAEAILAKDPGARIIYLTSHEENEVVLTAMATGAKDFLVKDLPAQEQAEHIRNVMEGQAQLTARVQDVLMGEYKRLRKSEEGLMYFIQHLSSLTPAEKELVSCFLEGLKIKQIAQRRSVEPVTVKSQIRTLLAKTGCSRTGEIVSRIRALGLEKLFS